MTPSQQEQSDLPQRHEPPAPEGAFLQRPVDDSAILAGQPGEPESHVGREPLRIEVGARVYSSDGEEVAVVEMLSADTLGIRASSPGRSISVPASGIARVSQRGRRVDLCASGAQVRALSGAQRPGYNHLQAQQPNALAVEECGDPHARIALPDQPNASEGPAPR